MPTTPWLTESQQAVWRTFLTMSAALDRRIEQDMQASSAMPHSYYLVLAMLSEAPERTLRMSLLAEQAKMSQSRLSHAVTRLQELGYVTRRAAADDRRGQLATLTDTGWTRLVGAAPNHAETVRSIMFDGMTDDEVETFGALCTTILARAEGRPG